METLRHFIETNGIKAVVDYADSNPNMANDEWSRTARHFKVVLRCQGRQLTTHFSQGSAHTQEPTAADVLDCLASDSAGIENARSFEDWCGEYGYDTDSRKAERIFKVCERQAESLKRLLNGQYETLLWNVERA